MEMKMQGTRRDLDNEHEVLEPGEYGWHADHKKWYCRAPQTKEGFYAGFGSLGNHQVTEHEDGTITVSPSILITGHHGVRWHGYLERGVWREV
jgi:hypothetical protein